METVTWRPWKGVGLLGVVPFFALVLMLALKVGRVFAWLRRTSNVRHSWSRSPWCWLPGWCMRALKTGFSRWVTTSAYFSGCWRLRFWTCCLRPRLRSSIARSPTSASGLGTGRKRGRARAMMHLFLNGLAASAGGGLTYLRNVLPHLSARAGVQVTAAMNPQLRREFSGLPRVSLPEINFQAGTVSRFWQEQTSLPAAIRRVAPMCCFQSAISLCESLRCHRFCSRETPSIPPRTFSAICANAGSMVCGWIPGSRAAWRGVPSAGRTAPSLRPRLSRRNCGGGPDVMWWPSITDLTKRHFFAIRHPLPEDIQQKLDREAEKDTLRLLYVSHYNYYRNFETLFQALPLMRERLGGRKLQLFLTCRLRSGRQSRKL